jgi:hypothetical protein
MWKPLAATDGDFGEGSTLWHRSPCSAENSGALTKAGAVAANKKDEDLVRG